MNFFKNNSSGTTFIIASGEKQQTSSQQAKAYDSIATFKSLTAKDSPELQNLMGELSGKISPEAFSEFCHSFADGVDYIKHKYNVQPAAIVFDSEHDTTPYTNIDNYIIHIPLKFIERILNGKETGSSLELMPFAVTQLDGATMYGVHEAYHIAQSLLMPELVASSSKNPMPSNSSDEYHLQSDMELDARREVHDAMIELGIAQRSEVFPYNPHKAPGSWASDILKERTKPALPQPIISI